MRQGCRVHALTGRETVTRASGGAFFIVDFYNHPPLVLPAGNTMKKRRIYISIMLASDTGGSS